MTWVRPGLSQFGPGFDNLVRHEAARQVWLLQIPEFPVSAMLQPGRGKLILTKHVRRIRIVKKRIIMVHIMHLYRPHEPKS